MPPPPFTPAAATEADLMRRIAARQMHAFEAFYRLYHPRLNRFLLRMTRRPSLVDEIINDTMLVVWERADRFDQGSKVSTWLFGIAYRQGLKALRHVDSRLEAGEDLTQACELPSADTAPDIRVQQQHARALLDQALAEISPQQRAIMELTYYFGHSCAEIAEIVECPVGTVKTRMFHAKRRLRDVLGESNREAI